MELVGFLESGASRIVQAQAPRLLPGPLLPAYDGQAHDDLPGAYRSDRAPALTAHLVTIPDAYLCIQPRLDGVVITGEGRLVEQTTFFTLRHNRLEFEQVRAEAVQLDTPVFTGVDTNWYNYFHWTAFALGKFAIADPYLDAGCEIVIPPFGVHDPGLVPPGFSLDVYENSLGGLGLGRKVRILPPGFYKAPEINILWTDSGQPTDLAWLESFYRPFAAAGRRFDRGGRRKILITKRQNPRISPEEGDRLRRIAAARGFEAVELEGFNFAEEMELFANADQIVAPHGAGLANVVYARPGSRVLELNSDLDGQGAVRPWNLQLSRCAGHRYSYLNRSKGDLSEDSLQAAFEGLES